MKIKAIIGCGNGDCGKGRMVDSVANHKSLVVRFNGGAQAGHTVVHSNGKRHAFRHIGAGTLKGAATYLSKFFVVNPMFFSKEHKEIVEKFGICPNVIVNPFCFVTTPWDMMVNQILEDSRGENKHGSCGVGINETIERSLKMPLNVQMLRGEYCKQIINHIRYEYVPCRLKDLDLEPEEKYLKWIKSDGVYDRYLRNIEQFFEDVTIGDPTFEDYSDVIFEGAQGLMLDQRHENFPHVTRSNTGCQNVGLLMEEFNMRDEVELIYVTRSYLTRHGAGPLLHEDPTMEIPDETNIVNPFQGKLRFGLLDTDRLILEVSKDMEKIRVPFSPSIAVTCLDQNPGHVIINDQEEYLSWDLRLSKVLADRLNFHKAYGSHSACSNAPLQTWTRQEVLNG